MPIEYSHSSSGRRLRSTVGTRMRDPAITSAYSSIAAFLVGEDSLLNGLSGLAGSAACVVVRVPGRHPRFLRDRPHGGGLITLLAEHPQGDLRDRGPRLFALGAPHGPHPRARNRHRDDHQRILNAFKQNAQV
jgi:hypothetical protein